MIGVIADDLTGAAELGGVGLRYGLRPEIVVQALPSGEANLVCIDTDSRSCGPKEAGRRAAMAARTLHTCGALWIYKKVDSVLRGQVVAELEAMMPQLGMKRALLVPANPGLGRTISEGEYFIRGRPIHQTEFACDPEYPRLSSRVLDLLSASRHRAIHVCKCNGKSRSVLPAEGIVVGEVGSAADLRRWAAVRTPDLLPAGGAEFFGALLARAGYKAITAHDKKLHSPAAGPHLFVCGTMSEASRDFIREARGCGTPAFRLPRGLARGGRMTAAAVEELSREVIAALRLNRAVIVHIGLPQVREPRAAKSLATQLVRVVAAVLRSTQLGQIFVEGGATAVELVRRMGWGRFTVLREVAPGVAALRVTDSSSLCVTMKPGSYVWPDQIRQLIKEPRL
jgi:D-threonate/D-erythronate kinase